MKIIVILIILLVLVYLFRKGFKENFYSLNILNYPDKDIEIHEKWIKQHANDTLLKKRDIIRFLKLLKPEINLLFYSKTYDTIMINHNNKSFNDKTTYIVDQLKAFFRGLHTSATGIVITINVGNDETRRDAFNTDLYNNLNTILISNLDTSVDTEKYLENGKLTEYDIVGNSELIHKYFVGRDINNLMRLLYKILEKKYIIDNNDNKTDDKLPCVIYDENTCDTNKCKWDDTICIPNTQQDNNPIDDCNSISAYGKAYCEITIDKDETVCKYQDKTHKCSNKSVDDNDIKCEDIAGDDEEFKTNCDSLTNGGGSEKCDYLKKTLTDSDGKETDYEFCISKDEAKGQKPKNPMTCLNFTSILDNTATNPVMFNESGDDENDSTILNKYDCTHTEKNGIKYYYNDTLIPKTYVENLDCGTFDNSNYIRNRNNTEDIKKQDNKKYRVTDIKKQKSLCEGITDRDSTNSKCKFVEFNYYNNKPLTKCLPKTINVSSNFIPDNDTATCNMLGYDSIGTLDKKKCIDVDAKCNDIKYKNVCDERDNTCFWNPGLNRLSDNRTDKFERGYCMNMDIVGLEQVIDKYHSDEIEKIAMFRNLEADLNKLNKDKLVLTELRGKYNIPSPV